MTLKDLLERSVQRHSERPALGFVRGEPFSYAGLLEKVHEFQEILAECGVAAEDKVAIIGENMPNWAVAYFAAVSMGAVAVPILQEFHPSAVHHILRHSEAKVVVASSRYMDKVEGENFPRLKTVVRMNDFSIVNDDEDEVEAEEPQASGFAEAVDMAREKLEILSDRARKLTDRMDEETMKKVSEAVESAREKFEELGDRARKLIDRKGVVKDVELTPDSVAAILYTSGTTGHSKGVVLTHRNLVSNALAGLEVFPVKEDDRFLSVLPMAHTYECTVGLIIPIHCGSSVYYLEKPPTPKTLLPAMQKVRPTIINVVPLIIEKIYKKRIKPKLNRKGVVGSLLKIGAARRKAARIAGSKLIEAFGGDLRLMCIGGAALAPEVERFLCDAEVPHAIGYGMTETAPLLAGIGPDKQRFRAIGPSIPGVELKILDPDPETGEGEILAKGPNVMREYYKAPKDTAATFTEDGWLLTGDLGVIDEDGYLFIKGRLKNVIIGPSGENIYPEEVESIINTCDLVMESLVYEVEGKVMARVHLNYDALDEQFDVSRMIESDVRDKVEGILEEIRNEVNGKVSTFARLARITEQVDPFEKTPTQKIKRFIYLN
ncbi:AMP-binding protein [Pseudodesulfovibrio cashew]|uniref:AMP-binding protein n=2 Tax=Pseudodesulfovibrio cashew TaxID=2678688 RepID=A0A6I6JLQ1_9BACT|nr:AMP-binding protein [Pseudodesulfovibrio cashew]